MRLTRKERKTIKRENKRLRKKYLAKSHTFLLSKEWAEIRMRVLKRDGARCACCGATRDDGLKMNVDHIKNRMNWPELALDINNLQVLCELCNKGKGNWDSTDWRSQKMDWDTELAASHMRSIKHG